MPVSYSDEPGLYRGFVGGSSTCKYQSVGTEAEGQGTSRLYRIQCRSSSVDCIVHFRRKYLKGLLSIPCDGRGARRPLGQSFRKSVGPAALYQVSAANRRDHLLIRRAYEHAMRATEI